MTNDARTIPVAVVQSAPILFDTPRTLDKLADLTADAARQRAELARAKFAFDVVGHCARPDVFTLHVNEQPKKPVVFDGRDDPKP